MSLLFNAKLRSFEKINENFLKAKCYVMALGKNANKSHFSKENVDKAYSTLSFIPVIGHLMSDDNGNHYLGGHDMKLDIGTLTLKSLCVPFGVAIPSETPIYEDVEEENGTKSTYLVTDVILWIGRYPELSEAIYSDKIYFNQSMEILFSKAEKLKDDPIYTDIIDFSFDALCLLNKSADPKFNVTPAFPSASVRPASYNLNADEFSILMKEMKEQLSFCLNNKDNQGGKNLDEKILLLQKYGKSVQDLDFSIDEMSIEDLNIKMEELFGENKVEPVAFSATYNQKREALNNVLSPIIVKDASGNYVEETYFWIADFSDEYVFVEKDHWTKDGYDCKHGRFSYTFDESSMTATVSSEFEEMVRVWLTLDEKAKLDEDRANYDAISTEYSEYKENHSYSNSDFEVLNEYKEQKEKHEREDAETSLFTEYEEEIGGTDEFAELKKNSKDYSIENLRKECLCIVGLYARANKKSEKDKNVIKPEGIKFSIDERQANDEEKPYGGLMEKFKNK